MLFPRSACLALAAACGAASYGQSDVVLRREGDAWVQSVSGSMPATGIGRLRIATRGAVTLRGEPGASITYSFTRRLQTRSEAEARRLAGAWQVRLSKQGDWATLVLAEPNSGLPAGSMIVHAPSQLRRFSIESRAGALDLAGLAGEVFAETGGGKIAADRIRGPLTARTGGGEIFLGSVSGSARCITGAGPIRITDVGGECWLDTGGGEITVQHAGGPVHASTGGGNIEIQRAAGPVSARTFGGLIKVQEADGEVTAESAGGGIHVGSAHGLRCESVAGGISLRRVSGEMRVSAAAGHILAELLAGRKLGDSFLSTGSGDVIVWIPSNLAVTIQARNDSAGRLGGIVSEFPEIRLEPQGVRDRRGTTAGGALNGGGPLLKVAAADGTIYLRRQR